MKQKTIKSPSTDIMKATSDDVKRYLYDALKANYVFEDGHVCGVDYDAEYLYFVAEYYNQGYYEITYRLSYTLTGVMVTFNGELEEVKRETVYTPIKSKEKVVAISDDGTNPFEEDGNIFRSIDKKISSAIQKAFDKIAGKKELPELPVIKQFNDDEMIAIEVMYAPPNVEDGHGECMDSETIHKMVESCNKAISEGRLSGGLFHSENISEIEILKAWVNECDCIIGETTVPEGLPIVKVQFHDEGLWELRKSGKLRGLSIGAMGERVKIEDEEV